MSSTPGGRVAVVHGDVDGMMCAAIIRRCLGDQVRVLFSGPREISRTLSEISGRGGELFVADIGINGDSLPAVVRELSRLKGSGWRITWVDHHVPPGGISKDLGDVVDFLRIEHAPSAASLLSESLECESELEDLVRIAEDADTATYSLREARLLRALSRVRSLRSEAIDQMALSGRLSGDLLKRAERELRREEKMVRRGLSKATVRLTSAGRRYALVILPRGGPGSLIGMALKSKGVAFTLVVRGTGSFSLYAGNDLDVDLRKVCSMMGGGGHSYACGGPLRLNWFKRLLFRFFGPWYVPSEVWRLVEEVERNY